MRPQEIKTRLQNATRRVIAKNEDPASLREELCTIVIDTLDEANILYFETPVGVMTPVEFANKVCQALDDAVMNSCEESIWERVELAIQETVEKEL
jgi:hypothetical protein